MMRRLLFTLGFLVAFTGVVEAQQEILRSDGRRTQVDTYLRALKTLHIPYGPVPTFDGGLVKPGSIFYNTTDSALYIWNDVEWMEVGKDPDLSNYYTVPQVDSLLTYFATIDSVNSWLAGKVDKTITINGYPLSGDITLVASDVGALTKVLADTYYKDIAWLPDWDEVQDKPSVFPPDAHTHPISDVIGLLDSLGAKVNITTTINGQPLSADVVLTADDVGALTKALADTYYKSIDWLPSWSEVTDKPATFPPSAHTHPISEVVNLQDALDGKQATITGAASTITSADLTADRVLVSSGAGKVAASEVTAAELGRLSGVTSPIQTQIDSKVDKSTTITNTGGINISGSLASGNVSLGLNETYLNNRYLRKDRNDGNDDYTLSVGKLVGDTVNASRLELPSLSTTTEEEYLVVDANGVVSKRTIDQMTFDVGNSGGTAQFSVGDQDQIRFQGTGDTQVSFNAATKTIVINSVPGQGGGGVVTSVFGRDGGVVAEAGDYNTDLVTEGSNLYFTDGRVRSTELTGLTLSTSSIVATDNVLQALGKAQGQINTRAASSRELEVSGTAGRVIVSGGAQDLTQNREWIVDLVPSGVTVGTYPKVTVDTYGRVTAGASLVAADIPNLPAGKITSGTFNLARLATGTAAAGHYIDGGTGAWTPLPSTDLSNYYTRTETDGLLDDKFDIPTGTTGQYVRGDGSLAAFPAIPQGTVTSVGISVPSNLLSVTGSPVTSSGTFNVTLPNRAANLVFAGPATGAAASPAFRSLVQNDIPALAISKITGLQDALDGKEGAFSKGSLVAGDGVTLTGTLSNRLVGSGNVTISADIEEANLIAGAGISITGTYPDKTITNTAPNATHTGDVVGSQELTIASGVVTNAKLANVPTGTIKGRVATGPGSPEDLTPAQVRALINVANGATANQTDAFLLNRANHTGSQAISTVTGLQTALDGKQATLVSGTNIKTINGASILGSGNIVTPNDNTTYTAGSGITLTGTEFSVPVSVTGTGTFVSNITQTASGIAVTLGTPPNTTYSTMSAAEINAGIVTTGRTISSKVLNDWLNAKNYLTTVAWGDVTGKPTTFTPSAHTHNANDINAGTLNIARIPTGTTSSTVALGNHTHTFSSITSKPTTLSGYGITDAYTKDEVYNKSEAEALANKATSFATLNNTLYPTTQAVANYVTSQIPVSQTLSQPAIGQLAISGGNTVNLNTVNMSGNQTGIAGNKTWTGIHTFSSNVILNSSGTTTQTLLFRSDGNNDWGIQKTGGSKNLVFNRYIDGAIQGPALSLINPTGAVIIHNLSGTGNGIVGVNASGTLTRNNPSDLGLATLDEIGNLPSLTTTDKSNLVNAINEVNGKASALDDFGGRNYAIETVERGYNLGRDLVPDNRYRTLKTLELPIGIYIISHMTNMGVRIEPSENYNYLQGSGNYNFNNPVQIEVTTASVFYISMRYSDTSDLGDDYLTLEGIGFKLEKGSVPTDWTPAPEDQVSDWDESDSTKYSFIKNKPTIPAAQVNSDWNATSGVAQILNKPTIGNGALTLATGTGLSGAASFTANQSGNATFTVEAASGYAIPTTAKQTEWDTAYGWGDFRDYGLARIIAGPAGQNNDFSGVGSSFVTRQFGVGGSFFGITNTQRPQGWLIKGGASARWSWMGVTDSGPVRIYATNSANANDYVQVYHTGNLTNVSQLNNDLNYTAAGSNITLFNNNAGYIVGGTAADQVRTNADLDGRYIQTELDPTVPQYVKDISSGDISNWNSKISSITGGTGITVDATDPYNPIINASAQSLTITGDATGSGTGTIELTLANDSVKTQHIADTAVTTDKIRDGAVTLDKMADMNRGKLLGLGGIASNPWVPIAVYPGYSSWAVNLSYSVNHVVFTSAGAFRARVSVPPGYNPPDYPEYWEYIGPYRITFNSETAYDAGDVVVYAGTSTAYQTTSNVVGLAPDETPPSDPGTPVEITLDNSLSLGLDNVLRVNQSTTSIAGLIIGGTNVTITGGGTAGNPFIINSTGGGGGGGSTTLAGLTDVTLSSPTSGQYLRYNGISWENSSGYTLPIASASTLGGVRVGSGLSINPATGVLSATGTEASVFTRSVNGLVPAPGGSGATRYLREDGTWATPSGGGGGGGGIDQLTGDVLASGSGVVTATIANGAVTNAKMANMPANTIKGRAGSSGAPQNLSPYNVRQIIGTTNAISGTTINAALGSKQYASISTNTTYSVTNFDAGLELQVEITNTSTSPIEVNFTGVSFPVGYSNVIPAGRAAVFSMTKFNTIIRGTKVNY